MLLAAAFFLPALQAKAAPEAERKNIRIGLAYGTDAMPGANIRNSVGHGFRLGYYDSELNFQTLATTEESIISVVKTLNVYFFPLLSNGFQGYTDAKTSDIGVGCYHIQLPGSYQTCEEAITAAAGIEGAFPAWINGTYYVRTGAYLDGDSARAALSSLAVEGASIVGTSVYGVSVVKTGTAKILFQFDGDKNLALGVLPGLDDQVRSETWFMGTSYFGGFRFERINGGDLTVVNILDLEDYVNCVISQEMSESWPLEALKAQACCARTYAARLNSPHSAYHFDLCPSTHCQAYPGTGQIGPNTTQAAQETAGMYVRYGDKLALTTYSASDGGATESSKNVWTQDLPYLQGKEDPFEALVADKIPSYNWSYTCNTQDLVQIGERLRKNGYTTCTDVVDMWVSEYTPMGNVRSVTFTDSNGKNFTVYGSKMSNIISLRSYRFTISGGGNYYVNDGDKFSGIGGLYAVTGDGTVQQIDTTNGLPYVVTGSGVEQLAPTSSGSYTISGSGWGHNVGMSQWGAYAMAKEGYTYVDILKFYYTGVDIR